MAGYDLGLDDALQYAYFKHVPVFAATSTGTENDGHARVAFPARHRLVYGVSAADSNGNLYPSGAPLQPEKEDYATLGCGIDPFWMDSSADATQAAISGSSYGTAIATGAFAATLLAARITLRREKDLLERLKAHESSENLLKRLSIKAERHYYIEPTDLWTDLGRSDPVEIIKRLIVKTMPGRDGHHSRQDKSKGEEIINKGKGKANQTIHEEDLSASLPASSSLTSVGSQYEGQNLQGAPLENGEGYTQSQPALANYPYSQSAPAPQISYSTFNTVPVPQQRTNYPSAEPAQQEEEYVSPSMSNANYVAKPAALVDAYLTIDTAPRALTSAYATQQGQGGGPEDHPVETHQEKMKLPVLQKTGFGPGRVVRVLWYDADQEDSSRDGWDSPDSDEEASWEKRYAAHQRTREFLLLKTYPNYSLAVSVEKYSGGEQSDPHQAREASSKCCALPPDCAPFIQILFYDGFSEPLPMYRPLNYADVVIVEHEQPLEFIGSIMSSSWESIRRSYANFQESETGRPVLSLEAQPRSIFGDLERTSSSTHFDLDPGSLKTKFGSRKKDSGDEIVSFGSEATEVPLVPFHASDRISNRAMRQDVNAFSAKPRGYSATSELPITFFKEDGKQPPVEEFRDQRIDIVDSQSWIDAAALLREKMMFAILQSGQTVQSICDGSARHKYPQYAASRVKVAILDSHVDLASDVFKDYKARTEGHFKDFSNIKEIPTTGNDEVSHGTHVASLLLHMAPEADVYVGRAFDDKSCLAKAIWYAIKKWKVDIISISGGFKEFDFKISQALACAHYKKICVFAASHNDGRNSQVAYPAREGTVYPVSSTDYHGNPSKSAADPLPKRMNLATLGENIFPFWMIPLATSRNDPVLMRQCGSSFSTPIAAGIYASTLLGARLVFNGQQIEPLARLLKTHAVMERLLDVVSTPTNAGYCYVQPEELWSRHRVALEIERIVEGLCGGYRT